MVEYIEIDGVKYPFIYNLYVLGFVQQECDISYEELFNPQVFLKKIYLIEPTLYYGIKYGCLVTKTDFTIRREDMPLLMQDDKVFIQFMKVVPKFLVKEDEGVSTSKTSDNSDKKK